MATPRVSQFRIHDAGVSGRVEFHRGPDDYSGPEREPVATQGMSREEAIQRLLRMRDKAERRATDGHARDRIATTLELAEASPIDLDWAPYWAARLDATYALDYEALEIAILTLARQS